jgi:hypothetical protein
LANGPANYWSVVALALPAASAIHGVTASLVDPAGNVSPGTPFDINQGEQDGETSLAWTNADGSYFFQDPAFGFPQSWTIRWTFPDGETCDAPFTVT